MARLPENIQYEKDRLEMAQKLCQLLDKAGALLLEQNAVESADLVLMHDVHGRYRSKRGLVRVQAYPGFSNNEQAYVAARNIFGDRELVEAELPFAPEPIAEFVVERFEPVRA
jgi:hypothetical protein